MYWHAFFEKKLQSFLELALTISEIINKKAVQEGGGGGGVEDI